MPITRRTISIEWLRAENACNIEALKTIFGDRAEIELTPETIQSALHKGVLSSNWLARRILTGAERDEYERAMKPHMEAYERAMSQVLIEIIQQSERQPE